MPTTKFPPLYFESHMHFCSGHCAPLPLLWGKSGLLELGKPGRDTIDDLATIPQNLGIGDEFFRVAPYRTDVIGENWAGLLAAIEAMSSKPLAGLKLVDRDDFNKALKKLKHVGPYPGRLLCVSTVMTMDMDYAHIRGYWGLPIYDLSNAKLTRFVRDGELLYWKSTYRYRKNNVKRGQGSRPAICRSVKPTRSGMDGELLQQKSSKARKPKKARGFENWALQRSRTESVAYNHPFSVLPFYHYDFRRYIKDADPNRPFAKVVPPGGSSGETPGPYVGFKLYTAEGYRPLELAADSPYVGMSTSKLSVRDRNNIVRFQSGHTKLVEVQRAFYERCEAAGTPVLCHCSDGGVYTHDRELYVKLFADKQTYPSYRQRTKRWFNDHYVHPKAWRRVLTKYPKLKLCLAHWGGIDHWRRFSRDWRRWRTSTKNYGAKGKRSLSWIDECVRLVYEHDNFYVDLAYIPLFQLLDDEARDRRALNRASNLRATSHKGIAYLKWKKRVKSYEQRGIQWDYLSYLLDRDKDRGGKLRRRILWGTDWYMFGQDFESYGEYLSRNISALAKIQQRAGVAQNLFHQFAVVNNSRFHALPEIAEPLYQHFLAAAGNAKQRALVAGNRWRIDAFERLDPDKMQAQLDRDGRLAFEDC